MATAVSKTTVSLQCSGPVAVVIQGAPVPERLADTVVGLSLAVDSLTPKNEAERLMATAVSKTTASLQCGEPVPVPSIVEMLVVLRRFFFLFLDRLAVASLTPRIGVARSTTVRAVSETTSSLKCSGPVPVPSTSGTSKVEMLVVLRRCFFLFLDR
uniref:Uncharacterized protein n=1 Tax=Aureoumbra lagunensis TaxID=44058 RepID=A0A7S3JSA4_9STRA